MLLPGRSFRAGWQATTVLLTLLACPVVVRAADAAAPAAPTGSADAGANDDADLAKKLSNPVAALISVPFQSNWDFGAGPGDHGVKYTMNFQPVVPITLSKDWNLILRTIVPVIDQRGVLPRYVDGKYTGNTQSGFGDITQSFFFSPAKPLFGKLILGVGPALLYPTASNQYIGGGQWCVGPTLVGLVQEKGFTIGVLANNLSSFASSGSNRRSINSLFVQPFISYTTKKATSFTLNTESTYDWNSGQWTVPLNLTVGQIVKLGKLPVQFTIGGRAYVDRPAGGPNWGMRFVVTFLFPK